LGANVKAEVAVIAAKVSQDYKHLNDAFNGQITCNNSASARTAAVLRDRMMKRHWQYSCKLKIRRWKIIGSTMNEQWQGYRIHNEWKLSTMRRKQNKI
jgi:hypothetical protein